MNFGRFDNFQTNLPLSEMFRKLSIFDVLLLPTSPFANITQHILYVLFPSKHVENPSFTDLWHEISFRIWRYLLFATKFPMKIFAVNILYTCLGGVVLRANSRQFNMISRFSYGFTIIWHWNWSTKFRTTL